MLHTINVHAYYSNVLIYVRFDRLHASMEEAFSNHTDIYIYIVSVRLLIGPRLIMPNFV